MNQAFQHALPLMGEPARIEVLGEGATEQRRAEATHAIERAAGWFRAVESCCTRMNDESELRRITARIGEAVPVTAMLFKVAQFALVIAEESGGAFDPTLDYRARKPWAGLDYPVHPRIRKSVETDAPANYRDVLVDPSQQTITILRALVLDLDAVAKGLAIDLAAQELRSLEHFMIEAGSDRYFHGLAGDGEPWTVDIRDPRDERRAIDTLRVSNVAVCSAGTAAAQTGGIGAGQREQPSGDPRFGGLVRSPAAAIVIAPSAMVAATIAQAVSALDPEEGLRLLVRHEVEGILVGPASRKWATPGISQTPIGGAGSSRAS